MDIIIDGINSVSIKRKQESLRDLVVGRISHPYLLFIDKNKWVPGVYYIDNSCRLVDENMNVITRDYIKEVLQDTVIIENLCLIKNKSNRINSNQQDRVQDYVLYDDYTQIPGIYHIRDNSVFDENGNLYKS